MLDISKSLQGTLRYGKDRRLEIDGISVSSICEKFGTPVLILSEKRLGDNVKSIQEAFANQYENTIIAYSVKTNPLEFILKTIKNGKCCAEVVSQTEIELARKVGFENQNLIYDGPKSDDDLIFAAKAGIYVNIDSTEEYISLKNIAERLKQRINFGVRLRFTPQGLEENETLYNEDSPFGLTIEEAKQIFLDTKKSEFAKASGTHMHMLSSQTNPKAHRLVTKELVEFAKELHRNGIILDFINIGGGFGSRYLVEGNDNSITEFAKVISEELKKLPYSPKLVLEPGRYITADAFFGAAKVLRKKKMGGNKNSILTCNLGVNVLVPLKSAFFDIYDNISTDSHEIVDVRGPMPFHADEVRKDAQLGSKENDLILIANIGAYSTALSNNFTGQLRPPTIVIEDNGKLEIVERREIVDDILKRKIV